MPLSSPITGKDGKIMSEIFVPAGSAICVALRACNTNKEIWGEDAYEWIPERWLKPLPETVTNADMPGILPNLYVKISISFCTILYNSLFPTRMSFLGGGRGCM